MKTTAVRRTGALRGALVFLGVLSASPVAGAQAPVQERQAPDEPVLRGQQSAGVAYRDLEQARQEAQAAETEYLTARDAYRAAQEQAEALRRQFETSKRGLDAARLRQKQAQARYDKALAGVNQAFEKPPAR